MKRIIMVLSLTLLVIIGSKMTVNAYEPLPYWYADSSKIANYSASTINYNRDEGSCSSFSNFDSVIDYAQGEWDNEYEIDISLTTSSTATIENNCITRKQAQLQGINDTAIGNTISTYYTSYYATYAKPSGGIVRFHNMHSAEVSLIWDDGKLFGTAKTSDFTTTEWQAVAVHEWGHAMGYFGHSIYTHQVMYAYLGTTAYNYITHYDRKNMNLAYPYE